MTQAEIEAEINRLGTLVAKLQQQQEVRRQEWGRIAIRSAWLSVACVCIGAISAIAILIGGPVFYPVPLLSLFVLTSAPLGLLSRALRAASSEVYSRPQ